MGSFSALVSKWPVSRKVLVIERNGVKFGDPWTIVINIWGTFELVGFKVILGSFGALVSKWPVSRKGLVVKQNGVKF